MQQHADEKFRGFRGALNIEQPAFLQLPHVLDQQIVAALGSTLEIHKRDVRKPCALGDDQTQQGLVLAREDDPQPLLGKGAQCGSDVFRGLQFRLFPVQHNIVDHGSEQHVLGRKIAVESRF